MMRAARIARRFGGVLAITLALIAISAAAESVKPGLTPSVTGAPDSAPTPADTTAALAEAPGQELLASLAFAPQTVELNDAGRRSLIALAERLAKEPQSRLAILAYAGADGANMSARRISLGRALAVRSFLIEHGVRSQRMIVRALGKPAGAEPAERVDILWPPQ